MRTVLKMPPPAVVTWEDYERNERKSELRHKFVNAEVFATAGARWNHNRIAGAIFTELSMQLKDKPCEAFISDLKLRI